MFDFTSVGGGFFLLKEWVSRLAVNQTQTLTNLGKTSQPMVGPVPQASSTTRRIRALLQGILVSLILRAVLIATVHARGWGVGGRGIVKYRIPTFHPGLNDLTHQNYFSFSWTHSMRLRSRSTLGHCPTTVGQDMHLLREQTDFDVTVGQRLVSEGNSAC